MSGLPAHPAFPALGPRLTFFTGGTALRALSRELTRHTHKSVHLVTTFDSGGSSAALRQAFAMPAMGDIRNRLLALADSSVVPAAVLDFCAGRLPSRKEFSAGGEGSATGGKDPAHILRRQLVETGRAGHPGMTGDRVEFVEQTFVHECRFRYRTAAMAA